MGNNITRERKILNQQLQDGCVHIRHRIYNIYNKRSKGPNLLGLDALYFASAEPAAVG